MDYKVIINDWIKNNNVNETLDLSNLNLKDIPNLPNNLKYLNINNNLIVNICNLPQSLLQLNCKFNRIKIIENLPTELLVLNCSNNLITKIINLPNKLNELNCNENYIHELPILPDSLNYIDITATYITTITNIPKNLMHLRFNETLVVLTYLQYTTLINNKNINAFNKYLILEKIIINYDKFNEFYNQNINKCFLTDSYSLNTKNINKWLEKLNDYNDPDLLIFGYCIAKTINHISFKEFYDNLCKLSLKINTVINTKKNIYIYIPDIKKSQLWVLLLLWKFIKFNNIYIILSLDYYKLFKDDVIIIYLDDCSYSGLQIDNTLKRYKKLHNYFSEIYETTKNIQDVFYIFVPFISNNALKKLKDINVFYINKIKNFEQTLDSFELQSYNIVKKNYSIYNNGNITICNLYFDHKLADFISIFQPLYAFGRLPDINNIPNNSGSFINNCETFYKKYETNKELLSDENIDLQMIIPQLCPPAFYKNIDYTFNNNKIKYLYDINFN